MLAVAGLLANPRIRAVCRVNLRVP